jgi:hypothetical protein
VKSTRLERSSQRYEIGARSTGSVTGPAEGSAGRADPLRLPLWPHHAVYYCVLLLREVQSGSSPDIRYCGCIGGSHAAGP